MNQPRAKSGQFRPYGKGERYAAQFRLLHGERPESLDDVFARGLWTGAGAFFFATLFIWMLFEALVR